MPTERIRLSAVNRHADQSGTELYSDFEITTGYTQTAQTRMYLEYLSVNYSCHNFQEQARFDYTWPASVPEQKTVAIGDPATPYRNYTVDQLNGLLQAVMLENGHVLLDATNLPVYYVSLVADRSTGKVLCTANPLPTALPSGWTNPGAWTLPAAPATPTLIFTAGSVPATRLGFTGVVPPASSTTSFERSSAWPQMDPYQIITLRCDIADDVRGGPRTGEIHSFDFVGVSFGSQLQFRVQTPLKYAVKPGSRIRMQFLTPTGQPVPLREPNVDIVLAFEY